MILEFHGIEWETINNSFSERYVEFLNERLSESEEYYEDNVFLLSTIEDQIKELCLQLGIEYSNINDVHETTVAHRQDNHLYSKLNDLIHYYEREQNNYPPRWGYRNGNSAIELQDSDYDFFTVNRKYGYLYVMYPHVARHFAEAVMADDPTGTIQPQTLARPNFFCWLGKDSIVENKFKVLAQSFIDRHKLSYELSDKKLALGYIPFAKLKNDVVDLEKRLRDEH